MTGKMAHYQYIGILLFSFIIYSPVAAQYSVNHNEADFVVQRTLSTENGMPANGINQILQDSKGYIWAATYNGVVRYDRKNIRIYDSSTIENLSSNRALSMIEDINGCIWAGMEYNYLLKICGEEETVYYLDEEIYGFNNHISTLAEDQEGKIWLGTSRGMVIYDGVGFSKMDHLPSQVSRQIRFYDGGLYVLFHRTIYRLDLDGSIDEIVVESNSEGEIRTKKFQIKEMSHEGSLIVDFFLIDGGMEIMTHTGLVRVKENEYTVLFTREDLRQELLHGMEVSGDTYLVYGSNGLMQITGLGGNVLDVLRYNSRSGRSVITDHEGSIWYGTNTQGVSQIITTPVYQGDRYDIFSESATMAILKDRDDDLWVGTNCDGLYKFGSRSVTRFDADNGIDNICIWSLMEQTDGTLWVGTWGGGVYQKVVGSEEFVRFRPPGMEDVDEVLSIYEDADGDIWFGSYYNGILKYDGEKAVEVLANGVEHVQGVRHFYETYERLWIASDRGIGYIENDVVHLPDSLDILSSKNFRTIAEDSRNRLWFGSYGGGLLILEEGKQPIKLTENHGLFENSVSQLNFDENENLWLGGNNGITFIESGQINDFLAGVTDRVRASKIGTAEGMPISETTGGFMPSSLYTEEGIFFVPTVQGLAEIHTRNMELNQTPPRVIIETVNVDGVGVTGSGLDELGYDTQRFVFNFSALSFKNPDYVRFRYKMEGVDYDWQPAGNVGEAVYTTLQPGSYTFKVIAANNDGFWSEEYATVSFTIVPPFWERSWFYFLLIALSTACVVGYIRYRTNVVNKNELRLRKIVKEKTEELRLEKNELELLNGKLKESNSQIEQNKKVIEEQTAELQKQNEMKSRFFANISHEFRTPLTLIKGITEQFKKGDHGKLDESAISDLKVLSYSADKIEQHIEQLLEVAMLKEADSVSLSKKQYDLCGQIELICSSLQSLAEQKSILFNINLPQEKLLIEADQTKIESVLLNLISNAINNTPAGKKINLYSVKREVEGTEGVYIQVEDAGPIIPESDREYIFDRFYQLKNSSEGSIGFGLSLVKEWVALHNGKVCVEKNENSGNRFSVFLPIGDVSDPSKTEKVEVHRGLVHQIQTPSLEQTEERSTEKNKNSETILVVEDNYALRLHLIKILGKSYNVIEAENGEEGLVSARKNLPDLILSDVMMPIMDGFEFCKKLRSDKAISYIPFILLTARAGVENTLEGLQRGADDYILKPFNEAILFETIKNQLNARKRLSEKLLVDQDLKSKFPASEADSFIESLDKIIDKNIEDPDLTVKQLAKSLNTSQRQFQRKVKEMVDLTPKQYLRKRRLNIARHLLQQKSGSVTEVAYAVGFSNLSLFSKYFKQEFGVLPSKLNSEE